MIPAGIFLSWLFICGCDSASGIPEKNNTGTLSEGYGTPRCPRCFKFLAEDEIKFLNQHTWSCLKCGRIGPVQQFYKRKK